MMILLLLSLILPSDPVELAGPNALKAWKAPTGAWLDVGAVKLDPADPKRLAWDEGKGVIVNGKTGRTRNLLSKDTFGDVELHVEFLVPKGSNAGVKLHGHYEVQIFDSFGVKTPTASDNGGIYPRAELLPRYRHIDDGYPPRVNASKPPGEWQTLDLTFLAPRFDKDGKKTADARFSKVVLNGQVIHENLSIPCPTGHAWRNKEMARGPILIQADHGPVAFRSIKVTPLDSETK